MSELNWIAKQDKTILLPKLEYRTLKNASGQYEWPCTAAPRGTIVIDQRFENTHVSTMAHEWRHYQQLYSLVGEGMKKQVVSFHADLPYRQAIMRFFLSSPIELDALAFELKHAPDEENIMRATWCGIRTPQRWFL